MIKVILHGSLKKIAPSGLSFDAASAKEAIEALCCQTEALRAGLGKKMHKVRVSGFDTYEKLISRTDVEEIHIVPVLRGGKNGIVQIVIGVVLIVAALVLGGVAQMLAPAPTIDTQASDPDASKILPTQQNTVKIGTRIPLGYGRHKVFGHYLSFNVQSTDVIFATLT